VENNLKYDVSALPDEQDQSTKKPRVDPEDIKQNRIRGKYYYAGGSARWMFGYGKTEVKTDVKNYIDKCEKKASISNGIKSDLGNLEYNHLRAQFPYCDVGDDMQQTNMTVISQYVLERISISIGEEEFERFIKLAYSMSKDNISFKGWVMELDFTHQLKTKASSDKVEFIKFICDTKEIEIPIKNYRIYDSNQENFVNNSDLPLKEDCWNTFANHMEPAMDGFAIVDMKGEIGKGIILFNLTCGAKHDLKLEYVRLFVEKFEFKPSWIEFAFITPNDQTNFNVSDTNGATLSGHKPATRSSLAREPPQTWQRWDINTNKIESFVFGNEKSDLSILKWKRSE
jgi:hypothetical protein